jgi:hypothetical protein
MQFNAQHQFGLHLNHRHLELEQDMVMLGTRFTEPSGYWTRPIKIDAINYGNVHGHFFKLVSKDDDDSYVWIAYTYYEGALSGNVGSGFFKAVAQYLREHGLIEVLGLQVLDDLSQPMVEIVLDIGTVMLDASKARYGKSYRTTGWVLQEQNGVIVFKGNFAHVPGEDKNPDSHTTFTDGK